MLNRIVPECFPAGQTPFENFGFFMISGGIKKASLMKCVKKRFFVCA